MGAPKDHELDPGCSLLYLRGERMDNITNEELVAMIQAGENVNSNLAELYQRNRGFIFQQTEKYHSVYEVEDVLQEAFIILHKAAYSHDPARGTFLNWLAHCLGYLLPRQLNATRDIKISTHMAELYARTRKYQGQFEREHGHEPTDQDVMEALGISDNQLKYIKRIDKLLAPTSLDAQTKEGGNMAEVIPDESDHYAEIEAALDKSLCDRILHDAMSVLTDQQKRIIQLRMQGKTFQEICTILNINHRQQVQDSEQRSLKKIRNRLQQKGLFNALYIDAYRGTYASFSRTFTSKPEKIAIEHLSDQKTLA